MLLGEQDAAGWQRWPRSGVCRAADLLRNARLDGAEFCRGYIQHWLKTEKEIPNQSAARIFAIATSILKAGTAAVGSQ